MGDHPVAIIGGGPVGFSVAIDLARRGRRSVVVEQDVGTATVLLAKAGFLNERSMELFRRWGIAERVAGWGCPEDYPRDTVYCTSLSGLLVGRSPLECARDRIRPDSTPEINRKCPQYVLDPLLAQVARETGLVDVRYGMRFESLVQDADGVDLRLSDVATGRSSALRAAFVVGCDGATSAVREALGIPFEGQTLDYSVSALVRIEGLERYHPLGRAERFMFIGEKGTWANLTSVDLLSLWRFTVLGSSQKLDLAALDMKADLCRAFGREDIPFEIVRYVPWKRSQCAAKSFRQGRVLLAGDSAHTTSPTGGHGLNTGLGDAAGAGWVIDAVMSGWGGEGLLSAYSTERRRVAIRNSATSTRNYQSWVGGADFSQVHAEGEAGDANRRALGELLDRSLYPEWNSYGVAMGYRYDDSPVILPDGTPATEDDDSVYIPTARPGHRAPHAWLGDGRSTLDLFGQSFVLMRFSASPEVANAPTVSPVVAAAMYRSIPLVVFDCADEKIAELYARKIVLVRPDGHVAWRADALPGDVGGLLDRVRGMPR